jgi:hypothetical protein
MLILSPIFGSFLIAFVLGLFCLFSGQTEAENKILFRLRIMPLNFACTAFFLSSSSFSNLSLLFVYLFSFKLKSNSSIFI